MSRTKWMRLTVRDPADVLRWAGQQNAQRLEDYRYRVVGGREFISFRMVPRYAIEIGTRDIVVLAYARGGLRRRLATALYAVTRRGLRKAGEVGSWLTAPRPVAAPQTAELFQLPAVRMTAPSRG